MATIFCVVAPGDDNFHVVDQVTRTGPNDDIFFFRCSSDDDVNCLVFAVPVSRSIEM